MISEPSTDLNRLIRWEATGGAWRLLRSVDGEIEIELLTCNGGEVMDLIATRQPDVLSYVAGLSGE